MRRFLERLREWWREFMKQYEDAIDRDIDRALHGMVMYSELGERYELIQKHYPNILARLEASAERRERKFKASQANFLPMSN